MLHASLLDAVTYVLAQHNAERSVYTTEPISPIIRRLILPAFAPEDVALANQNKANGGTDVVFVVMVPGPDETKTVTGDGGVVTKIVEAGEPVTLGYVLVLYSGENCDYTAALTYVM